MSNTPHRIQNDQIPNPYCIPSLLQFGSDIVSELPLPTLNHTQFEMLDALQNRSSSSKKPVNLVQDPQHSRDVQKVLNSKDPQLAKTVTDVMMSADVSYL
jgi:hypothetical protein